MAWPLKIEAGGQVDVGVQTDPCCPRSPSFWKGCFAVKSVLMKRKISPPAVAQRPASSRRHLQARGRMLLGHSSPFSALSESCMLRVLACFLDILAKCSEASLAHIVASYSEPMVLGVVTSVAVGLEGYGDRTVRSASSDALRL